MANQIDTNSDGNTSKPLHVGKPAWLKSKIPTGPEYFRIKRELRDRKLYTVCEEAKCPNIGECWSRRTATFMVLGDTCTRACRFCNINTGNPNGWVDEKEPLHTAESVRDMQLKYVVLTMVDRDDMADGGAAHVGKVIDEIKRLNPNIIVEILAGDFRGLDESLKSVLRSEPKVFAHNIETVERLSPRVRDARATYRTSLSVLKRVKELADYQVFTKSALMLGLGESMEEVHQALRDLRDYDVDFVTLGQYLRPSKKHLAIKRWVTPDEFKELEVYARQIGFKSVASGPLVRSSYKAWDYFETAER